MSWMDAFNNTYAVILRNASWTLNSSIDTNTLIKVLTCYSGVLSVF